MSAGVGGVTARASPLAGRAHGRSARPAAATLAHRVTGIEKPGPKLPPMAPVRRLDVRLCRSSPTDTARVTGRSRSGQDEIPVRSSGSRQRRKTRRQSSRKALCPFEPSIPSATRGAAGNTDRDTRAPARAHRERNTGRVRRYSSSMFPSSSNVSPNRPRGKSANRDAWRLSEDAAELTAGRHARRRKARLGSQWSVIANGAWP